LLGHLRRNSSKQLIGHYPRNGVKKNNSRTIPQPAWSNLGPSFGDRYQSLAFLKKYSDATRNPSEPYEKSSESSNSFARISFWPASVGAKSVIGVEDNILKKQSTFAEKVSN